MSSELILGLTRPRKTGQEYFGWFPGGAVLSQESSVTQQQIFDSFS